MRVEGYAVEWILRVLSQQGLSIAARTYRPWKQPARVADRTVTDALVEDKIRELALDVQRHHPAVADDPLKGSKGGGSGSRCSAARKASRARPARRWTGR